MSNTFTKGVHRFVVDLVTEDSASVIRTYQSISNGAWEVNPSATISTDAFYPENIATSIATALDSVFGGNSLCHKIEITDGTYNRVGISFPTADGQASPFTLGFVGKNTSKWIRGTALTLTPGASGNDIVETKFGTTTDNAFSTVNYGRLYMGRIVYPTNTSSNANNTSNCEVDFKGKLIIKVTVTDDWYAIGINSYYQVNDLAQAEGTYIDNNIIIGNDYMMLPNGYDTSSTRNPESLIYTLDENGAAGSANYFNHFCPQNAVQGSATLCKLNYCGIDTGFYTASGKIFLSITGDWGETYTALDKSKYLGEYLTKGFVENAITVEGKSFDALLGLHPSGGNRIMFFREHV